MNCRQARELISPYLDQQLTGEQMLAMQGHLRDCRGCAQEYAQVRQVRSLLRSLSVIDPATPVEVRITRRLAESERGWHSSCDLSLTVLARPQRGRRLATAMVLSCIGLLALAVPFAPSNGDIKTARAESHSETSDPMEALSGSLPQPSPVPHLITAGMLSVPTFGMAQDTGTPRSALPHTGASMTLSSWSAEPLGDEAVGGYWAGNAVLVGSHGR